MMLQALHITRQSFGKLALAASAFLTESSVCTAFQDAATQPANAAATSASESLQLTHSVALRGEALETSILAAVERLDRDIENYDRLPPELQSHVRVIKAALFNPRTAPQVLASLTPEQLCDQEIARSVVLSSPLWAAKGVDYPAISQSHTIAEQLEQVLTLRIGSVNKFTGLYCALSPAVRRDTLIGAMRFTIHARLNAMLDEASLPDSCAAYERAAPRGLITLAYAQQLIDARLSKLDRTAQLSLVRFLNLEMSDTQTLIDTLDVAPEEALTLLKPHEMSPSLSQKLAQYIQAHPKESAAILKTRVDLLDNPAIMEAAYPLIAQDITIIRDLPPSAESVKRCTDAVRQFLSQEGEVDHIANEIRRDITSLTRYPSLVMQAPEIQHATRQAINSIQYYKTYFFSWGIEHITLATLVGRFVHEIPDFAGLITTLEEYEACAHLIPDILGANPGAHIRLGGINPRLDLSAVPESISVHAALGLLEIEGVGRFDNAVELIINRFHSASPKLREKLRPLLQLNESFMNRLRSLDSDPACDPRPVCVVLMAKPITDYNGALDCRKHDGRGDNIDSLTSFYRVVYYEVGSPKEALRAVTETYRALGKKTELLIVGGHGDSEGINLNPTAFPTPTLRHSDVAELNLLAEAFEEQSKIVLASCSAAKSFNGRPSLAEEFHQALPFTTVYGANEATPSLLTFFSTGEFQAASFSSADRVAYLPHQTEPVVEERFNRPLEYSRIALQSLGENRFATLAAIIAAAFWYEGRKKKQEGSSTTLAEMGGTPNAESTTRAPSGEDSVSDTMDHAEEDSTPERTVT